MNNTVPEPRADKNGKIVTKHVRADQRMPDKKNRSVSGAPPQHEVIEVEQEPTMLSTAELLVETENLSYPARDLPREEHSELIREWQEGTRALEARWKPWLAEEYAANLPKDLTDKIFDRAWRDGHAYGYAEVEMHYQDITEFTTAAFEAGRNLSKTTAATQGATEEQMAGAETVARYSR